MNASRKIKVLVVDDHALMRDGVSAMLKQVDDIQLVGSLSSGEDAVNSFRELNPDVIIMDIIMKGMTGIEATRWIKERDNNVKVILLSMEVTKEFVTAGIQSGIDGYLPKDVEKEILITAIREVNNQMKYFNDAITTLIFDDFYQRKKASVQVERHSKVSDLTKREEEVLTIVANGKSNKEVAEELFISVKTVETHKAHILDKLGLKNNAELIKYALKNGLITL
ncbi:MAG: response regulator transcription factor [Cyclobacteriaceae bacterium]|nr:response regulator transcription factor [Cyclobacteriaceae bacterium]